MDVVLQLAVVAGDVAAPEAAVECCTLAAGGVADVKWAIDQRRAAAGTVGAAEAQLAATGGKAL